MKRKGIKGAVLATSMLVATMLSPKTMAASIPGKGANLVGSFSHTEVNNQKNYEMSVVLPSKLPNDRIAKLTRADVVKLVEAKYKKGIISKIIKKDGKTEITKNEEKVGTGAVVELTTGRNGYEIPKVGDKVKTQEGWKKLISIESFEGLEDCYDFVVKGKDGQNVRNYFANGTLVQGSY